MATLPQAGDRDDLVPLVVVGGRAALVDGVAEVGGTVAEVLRRAAELELARRPRWAVFSARQALAPLAASGVAVRRAWDIAEAHRLINGGWAADPSRAWAGVAGLSTDEMPSRPGDDLFDFVRAAATAPDPSPDSPLRPDGYLRPEALDPSWAVTDERVRALARLVRDIAVRQRDLLAGIGPRAVRTAWSESAAAVLCVELERDGLPVDRARAEELIAGAAGLRPADEAEAVQRRRERDRRVLRHAPGREGTDLRNPAHVRQLLASVGVHVPSTRRWVLEPFRGTHPLVEALLQWRRDERVATTYGYRWLDEHVGSDDRLRGGWTACDGAGGRMTAQNGLHNLPAPLRSAVAAREGHVFVRADLGQIEPRVLAVVSADPSLAKATRADDLYAPVAARLGVERSVAKVTVLAAMYGQRSGSAGEALRGLERAYPVAMGHLDRAYEAGVHRRPLRTFGGRLIVLDGAPAPGDATPGATAATASPGARAATASAGARAASRGRFARNALIQGAAAELFKAWAATVRHAIADLDAEIVLCLHDELLVHVPEAHADEVQARVVRALTDSARRWAGTGEVRFVVDASIIGRWSEAKEG
ncbi:MAG: DNA polymerase [Lapillicoccus sp.]